MPYKSAAQRRYFNANRSKLEAEGVDVDEWNAASKGQDPPERVKPMAKKHWMQGVSEEIEEKGTKGATKRAAERAGETAREWAEEHQHDANPKTRGRASLALRFMSAKRKK